MTRLMSKSTRPFQLESHPAYVRFMHGIASWLFEGSCKVHASTLYFNEQLVCAKQLHEGRVQRQ